MKTRTILLGASNVAISFPSLYSSLEGSRGPGHELWGAFGHGRSYGLPTRVLGRGLPSIAHCGLWHALEARPPAEHTQALVADVGNDLLFGPSVDTIAGWVARCVVKLVLQGARVRIVGLPLSSIASLSPTRFLAFRTLLYPACKKPFGQIQDEAQALDHALQDIAREHGATFQSPRSEWFGFDPVHIRPRAMQGAWEELLAPRAELRTGTEKGAHTGSDLSWWLRRHLWMLPPQERTVWGHHRHVSQPVFESGGGNAVFLF